VNTNRPIAKLRAALNGDSSWSLVNSALLMLERFLYCDAGKNHVAPFVRAPVSVQGVYNNFVIASLPCWLVGLWNVGHQINLTVEAGQLESLPGWRGTILQASGIGYNPDNFLACSIHGLMYFIPLFVLILLVTTFWSALFATLRRHPPDEGLLAFAWLFSLLLPAGVPMVPVIVGVSFAAVFGKHIYGGSGFYLINPVVVGMVFLWLAYPAVVFEPGNSVPIMTEITGPEATQQWWSAFFGARPGAIGATSVLGCGLGAVYLLITQSASWKIMLGSLLGIALAVQLLGLTALDGAGELSIAGELVTGGLAFGLVFLATDPVAASMTSGGRWIYGATTGFLAILITLANPGVGEAVVFAIFIASLLAPLMDSAVISRYKARRQRRIGGVADG